MKSPSKSPELRRVSINEIVPYWRNPRDITLAIDKVKESIEQYGYQQPIMVDKKMVIIAGHTRYRALMLLGYQEIDVLVSDMPAKKAKEYRIIDNKTSEYASWTPDLILELKEFEDFDLVSTFFPEVQLEMGFAEGKGITPITQEQIDSIGSSMENRYADEGDSRNEGKIDITCPYCHQDFSLNRSDLDHDEIWS